MTEGWSAFIRKQKAGSAKQLHRYQQFQHSLELLMELVILPFDEPAAVIFRRLRKEFPRSGTQDLKIAAVSLAHDATVLTRNLLDFEKCLDCGSKTGWIERPFNPSPTSPSCAGFANCAGLRWKNPLAP